MAIVFLEKWKKKKIPEDLQFAPDVALECKDFPNFGIWSKPGINALVPGEVFEKSYGIIVY